MDYLKQALIGIIIGAVIGVMVISNNQKLQNDCQQHFFSYQERVLDNVRGK